MRKPTLQSLADELGLSRQTISNAINAPERVQAGTLERVLSAIAASGYHPSAAARALRTSQSLTLALRLPFRSDGLTGQVMDDFLHAVTTQAATHHYRILLFTGHDPASELAQLDQMATTGAVDGCILTDTHRADPRPGHLAAAGLPFVTFGRPWGMDAQHSWVDIDGREGTALAVRHLQQAGHARIGHIGWRETSELATDRRAGWLEASGVPAADVADHWVPTDDGIPAGRAAMARLLGRGIEAAVTASDALAIGAALELQRHGLAPAVVGFDDTPVARALGLASIRPPIDEAARVLVDMLVGRIASPEGAHQGLLLTPELAVNGPGRTSGTQTVERSP